MSEPTELLPTIEQLREWFRWDEESGRLFHRNKPGKGQKWNRPAGAPDTKGRLRVEISGRSFPVSHIVFAIDRGRWPVGQVDHRNRVKTDNHPSNLREATNMQNSCNRPGRSKHGKGVTFHKGRFNARIMKDGKMFHLGCFSDAAEARKAYNYAAVSLHGEFALTNGTDNV